ncbi:peptidoglycan DD-metalloendopeptidase family protein [Vibrio salinus]|uniref:peptidoglycan DD-metalloendopeptidase family protein n=1 Tax=Vibrio salinus TaxID=2899784 RepID=UPI001E418F6A|nr:peptidoglycan DD-metalloendopeptidase family protein [Vibrio salinus]MCE0494204.1 peptidoglycan DD-metalloendopeptidase family protein [Vibrio salinus]
MRLGGQIVVTVFSALLLAGCSVTGPAPVTDLTKNYHSSKKGSYRGSYYIVNKGDTLYYIAYVTDKDVNDLIRYNHLKSPYVIHPGQKINLWRPSYLAPKYGNSAPITAVSPKLTDHSLVNSKSEAHTHNSKNKHDGVKRSAVKGVESSKSKRYGESVSKNNVNKNVAKAKIGNSKIKHWVWPTRGRLIRKFSSGDQGNKGIDIAGRRGQNIVSATAGTVVYSGNALRGYGNLIIIKHNDKYLSAYAHNDRLLVKEGQSVKAGQKIATMGSSGTNSVRLHFEIRYQGKSVNPIHYLP